jgi:hypothetical protein
MQFVFSVALSLPMSKHVQGETSWWSLPGHLNGVTPFCMVEDALTRLSCLLVMLQLEE